MAITYPIARNGIYRSIQGEGALIGIPMVFVRLAGCSVGCPQCDTDYRLFERLAVTEIIERVKAVQWNTKWIWITGGEPTDHKELPQLMKSLEATGDIALCTAGVRPIEYAPKFLAVSPHGTPRDLKIPFAKQLNLVPGLNGLRLEEWRGFDTQGYSECFVTPPWAPDGPRHIRECREFVEANKGWRLGVQAHKTWGVS